MRWRITTGRLLIKSSASSVIISSAIFICDMLCYFCLKVAGEEGDLDKATSWFNIITQSLVYLILVSWISNTPDTIPANASHIVGVGVGALVLNKTTRKVP
ncbi:hypothetical protein Bca52824_066114 [Brassica carinata]|uniref:Uncharacterized protein n=1 Tax=Brassica carinata TaxID=52824 RepID=A0A8X7UAM7_BRACI|nr:hypothetical protein Bca52824_066114 [Brassica carinata]